MAKQTVKEQVDSKIKSLQETKAQELETVRLKLQEAQTQKEAAALEMKEATASMNLDAYDRAREAKRRAQTAIDMYSGKYDQVKQQEYISEAESDKVIDSLLAYEEELTADFEAAIAAPLKQLLEMQRDYSAAMDGVRQTIRTWETDIHANYSTRGATTFFDKETGTHTDRSKKPVPVRDRSNSTAANIIEEMLTRGGRLQKYAAGGEE